MNQHDLKMKYKVSLERVISSVDRSAVELVPTRNGQDEKWIIDMQLAMLAETNRLRDLQGLTPVGLKDIEDVEQMALGHSDYASKFALYCAELAMGLRKSYA